MEKQVLVIGPGSVSIPKHVKLQCAEAVGVKPDKFSCRFFALNLTSPEAEILLDPNGQAVCRVSGLRLGAYFHPNGKLEVKEVVARCGRGYYDKRHKKVQLERRRLRRDSEYWKRNLIEYNMGE